MSSKNSEPVTPEGTRLSPEVQALGSVLNVLNDQIFLTLFRVLGIVSIYDFQMTSLDTFADVSIVGPPGSSETKFSKFHLDKIKAVKSWFQYREGSKLGLDAWKEFNKATLIL